MRRIFFALACVIVLAFSAGHALATHAVTDLNMRSGPSTRYARVAVVPAGHQVSIIRCEGGWCYIQFRGILGWVSGRYLADGGYYRPAPPPPPPVFYPPRPYRYPPYRYPRSRRSPWYVPLPY